MHPGKPLPKASGKVKVSQVPTAFAKIARSKKPKKPKKTNAWKILTRSTGVQRLRAVQLLNSREGTVNKVAKTLGHDSRKLRRCCKQAPSLKTLLLQNLRSKNYCKSQKPKFNGLSNQKRAGHICGTLL